MDQLTVFWFRKDLRIHDNIALYKASSSKNPVAIYIYDPEIIEEEDFSSIHLELTNDSIEELSKLFLSQMSLLNVYKAKAVSVLNEINKKYGIKSLVTNHEVGNHKTLMRDRKISEYCKINRINWSQFQTNGVVKGLKNREGWSSRWDTQMRTEVISAPDLSKFKKLRGDVLIHNSASLGLKTIKYDKNIKGGENNALSQLYSFLNDRGKFYTKRISSPMASFNSCSRLSSFISQGNISIRQIVRATSNRQKQLRENNVKNSWLRSLNSFSSRLRWHCHFVQKLEMQPDLEFTNMVRTFDVIRNNFNSEYFEKWKLGNVGFPMVDACIRSLKKNGWINFRMRAMIVSFASYNLWLDWRKTSKFLSQYFIDYEPGIHYNQFQMQSGVTGINAIRIYNPVKQQEDHDPNGVFVKKWVPELRGVPNEYLRYPHLMSKAMQHKTGCVINKDYPEPIVDLKKTSLQAKKKIYDIKSSVITKVQSQEAFLKHGSRRKRNI